ncbi:MAG: GNAT family N-acetyltransferase [Actinobacteria bacterium]|uniref:Unannotated protein n=1 Tax=freshwater metagenome TaxID=449393 RepID=A0A6J7IFL3_9ZZZZ|nr:GNAT family N-acetyltransferase [Actinomycetota bacterium]
MTPHDLALDDPLWARALPVLQELRPHLTAQGRREVQFEGAPQGLRFTALLDAAGPDGTVLAVAGWRLMAMTSTGRSLYVDDLVTSAAHRSTGAGRALLAELERRAREAGCSRLVLDSGVHRFDAHRFYLRLRMRISAHHFEKDLPAPGS